MNRPPLVICRRQGRQYALPVAAYPAAEGEGGAELGSRYPNASHRAEALPGLGGSRWADNPTAPLTGKGGRGKSVGTAWIRVVVAPEGLLALAPRVSSRNLSTRMPNLLRLMHARLKLLGWIALSLIVAAG